MMCMKARLTATAPRPPTADLHQMFVQSPVVTNCHAAQVLRVHVSPCRLKALPPEVQTGHRVIRHFSNPDNASR